MVADEKACPFCGEVVTNQSEERVLFLKKEITRGISARTLDRCHGLI